MIFPLPLGCWMFSCCPPRQGLWKGWNRESHQWGGIWAWAAPSKPALESSWECWNCPGWGEAQGRCLEGHLRHIQGPIPWIRAAVCSTQGRRGAHPAVPKHIQGGKQRGSALKDTRSAPRLCLRADPTWSSRLEGRDQLQSLTQRVQSPPQSGGDFRLSSLSNKERSLF